MEDVDFILKCLSDPNFVASEFDPTTDLDVCSISTAAWQELGQNLAEWGCIELLVDDPKNLDYRVVYRFDDPQQLTKFILSWS